MTVDKPPFAHPTHIVAVAGVVRRADGKILMEHVSYRDSWEFPGGQVERGETLEEAAVREIFEETGIEARIVRLKCLSSNVKTFYNEDGSVAVPPKLMCDFLCEYVAGEPRGSEETDRVCWMTEQEALSVIRQEHTLLRLRSVLGEEIHYLSYETKPFRLLSEREL